MTEARLTRNEIAILQFTLLAAMADGVLKVVLPLIGTAFTTSPLEISTLSFTLTLPFLLLSLHVGVLVDRYDRRTLLLVTGVLRVACLGVLTVAANSVGLPGLYAAGIVLGAVDVIALTAVSALLPNAIPRARWERMNASVTGMETTCAQFVGPVVGGLLFAAGATVALGTTTACFVLALVAVVVVVGDFRPRRSGVGDAVSIHRQIVEGVTFLWRQPILRVTSLAVGLMCTVWGAWYALIPLIATRELGFSAAEYGLLVGALGVGGILGAVGVSRMNAWLGRRRVMILDFAGTVALGAVPLVTGELWLVAASAFAGGFGGALWSVNARTISQQLVPDNLRGRYSATARLIGWGTLPLGAALAGGLGELIGPRPALAVLAVPVAMMAVPFMRVLDVDGRWEPEPVKVSDDV